MGGLLLHNLRQFPIHTRATEYSVLRIRTPSMPTAAPTFASPLFPPFSACSIPSTNLRRLIVPVVPVIVKMLSPALLVLTQIHSAMNRATHKRTGQILPSFSS